MKNLEDLAKFPSENPNPVLRATKNEILYINKVGESLLSLKEGDKIPKIYQNDLTEALDKNILKSLEIEINKRYYDFEIFPIRNEEYANVYGRDITERKKIKQKLIESETFSRALIHSMKEGFSVLDSNGNHLDVNPAFCKMTGFSRSELIGVGPPHPYWPEEELQQIENAFQKTTTGEVDEAELIFKRKNGDRFPVIVSPSQIVDENGIVISVYATVKDITERKKSEQKLKESEERWRAITKYTPDHIWVIDTNYKLTSVNYVIPNLTIDEVIGKHYSNFVQKEYIEQHEEILKEIMETGKTILWETGYIDNYGKQLYFDVHSGPLLKNGKVIGIVNRSTDVTDRIETEVKLKESEEKYRLIFENANDAISIIDLDGNFLEVNELYCSRLGYTTEEIMKKNIRDINIPEFADLVTNRILEIGKKESVIFESEHKAKDGRNIPIEINAKNILYYNKPSIFSIARDITERKKAEEDLREKEKYKFIFESMNDGVFIIDKDWRYIMMNDISANIVQTPKDDLLGRKMTDIFPGIENTVFGKNYAKVFETGEPSSVLDKFTHSDGREGWYETKIFPIPEGLLIIVTDITERKKAEIKIANLAKFPSENPNPVMRTTKEIVLYSNKAGEDLFNTIKGDKIPQVLQFKVIEALDSNTNISLEIELNEKTYSFNIAPIKEEGYANIYGIDITDRKCAEIDLQKSELTYREAYNRAEFYKDIFTHDINNILQNISNGIQLNEMYLNKPDKLKAVKRNIDIIKKQVKRGANLVSNVRKLSKISESENSLLNVNGIDVLTKTVNYIKNAFQDKNLKIDIQFIKDNFKILANELLEDVFENILTNSINYNDSEKITIEVKVSKELRQGINYIKFQFSDNGIGVTDERKDQIFIRGFSEKTSVHGMGLGLSLVKKIIDSYNGEIWMEDRVEGDYTKGSRCIILIPEVINNG